MNWLDIVIIVGLIIGVIHGFLTGIIKQIIFLVSLVVAILLSGAVANVLSHWIQPHIQEGNGFFSSGIQAAIFYILAFIIILSIFSILAKFIDKIINHTPVGFINKAFGALFGMFIWALSLSILLNFITVFDTQSNLISQEVKENSFYYDKVNMIFPMIFPYIQNLFQR